MSSHRPTLLAALALAATPALALAGPKEEAGKHIEAATKAHSEEKYDVALTELEAAYRLDPDPELLYAIGQVHSKLGNCADATTYFDRYLKTSKDPQIKQVIDQAKASCQPSQPVDSPPAVPPDPDTTSVGTASTTTTTAPTSSSAEGAPWHRGKLPYFLAGGGALAGIFGMLVYVDARSDLDAAEDAPTLSEYDALVDDAKSKRTISVVLVGGSVALIGAGVALYLLSDRDRAHESRGVSIAPTTTGGMITWSGSF